MNFHWDSLACLYCLARSTSIFACHSSGESDLIPRGFMERFQTIHKWPLSSFRPTGMVMIEGSYLLLLSISIVIGGVKCLNIHPWDFPWGLFIDNPSMDGSVEKFWLVLITKAIWLTRQLYWEYVENWWVVYMLDWVYMVGNRWHGNHFNFPRSLSSCSTTRKH